MIVLNRMMWTVHGSWRGWSYWRRFHRTPFPKPFLCLFSHIIQISLPSHTTQTATVWLCCCFSAVISVETPNLASHKLFSCSSSSPAATSSTGGWVGPSSFSLSLHSSFPPILIEMAFNSENIVLESKFEHTCRLEAGMGLKATLVCVLPLSCCWKCPCAGIAALGLGLRSCTQTLGPGNWEQIDWVSTLLQRVPVVPPRQGSTVPHAQG